MSKLTELEQQIRSLSPQEFAQLRAHLDELEAQAFDRQLEQDSALGKFDALETRLREKIRRGEWTEL